MSIQHVSATDPFIHEPKGISTASIRQVYVADGSGSGTWKIIPAALNKDIPNGNTAGSSWVVSTTSGQIIQVYAVVNTGFSANQTLTLKLGGVAVTGGVLSLTAAGSVAGTTFSCAPTALNVVTSGQAIEIVNSGGSSAGFDITLSILVD